MILQNNGIDADRLEAIESRVGEATVPEKIVSELEGLEGQRKLVTTDFEVKLLTIRTRFESGRSMPRRD
jgi:hypothetical protein